MTKHQVLEAHPLHINFSGAQAIQKAFEQFYKFTNLNKTAVKVLRKL